MTDNIGILREGHLHRAIKYWLVQGGDRIEVAVERFVIDLVRADGELVEVQTGGFAPLGPKLDALLDDHRMRIVHPIAARRRIMRVDEHGQLCKAPRYSPKRGSELELFERLVSWPSLLAHPNLTVEALLCDEDHIRGPGPRRSRTGRSMRDPGERRLRAVLGRCELRRPTDLLALLPAEVLAAPFTTRDLAVGAGCSLRLAGRAIYCLRMLELVAAEGTRGRAPLYRSLV